MTAIDQLRRLLCNVRSGAGQPNLERLFLRDNEISVRTAYVPCVHTQSKHAIEWIYLAHRLPNQQI
jgi:hypothetical protein